MLDRIWRAVAASGLVLLLTARVVSAHAELIRASPAPNSVVASAPSQVILWFDEPVDLSFSNIEVLDSHQARVDSADVGLAPGDPKQLAISLKPLVNGTYTVVWQALSAADGHVTRGNYGFGVGSPTGAPVSPKPAPSNGIDQNGPIAIAVRALELVSILALVGTLFFRDLLLDRSLRSIGMSENATRANARCRQLAAGSAVLAVISEGWGLALESSLLTGAIAPQGVALVLFETRLGALWLVRFVILALVCFLLLRVSPRKGLFFSIVGSLVLVWLYFGGLRGQVSFETLSKVVDAFVKSFSTGGALHHLAFFLGPFFIVYIVYVYQERSSPRPILYIFGIVALVTLALSGHSSAQGDLSLPVLADWLHLTAVALWVGGLAAFLWVIAPVWRQLPFEKRPAWLAALIPQFSRLALASVGVISITGLYSAFLNVGSWEALMGTLYGEILTSKVLFFALMLPLAAVNLQVMRRPFSAGRPEEMIARHYRVFRYLIGGEVAGGIVVIALAGYLTLTPPARGVLLAEKAAPPAPHVFLVGHPVPDVNVALSITPPSGSDQTFEATVTDASKQPAANILRVIFEFTWLEQDAGSTRVNVDTPENGGYRVSGSYLSLPGMWRLQVIVRRKGLEDVSATFPFYQTENATPALVNDPSALGLLKQSDAAMNKLKALRSIQFLNDGENGSVTTNYEYAAPDRLYFQVVGEGESIAIGGKQFYRDPGQPGWTERPRVDPFVFPSFDNAAQSQGVRLGRQETLDGVPTLIVLASTPVGNQHAYYAYWIGTQDHRVHQFLMVAPAHYMVQSYYDYDAPVSIQEPIAK